MGDNINIHAFSHDGRSPNLRNGSFRPANTAAVHYDGSLVPDAAVEAFVPASVIDAAVVELVFAQEEEERILHQQRRLFIGIAIPSVVVVLVVVIAVSILETNGKKAPTSVTVASNAAPSSMPSVRPSASPTTSYLPHILQDLTAVSDPKTLMNQSTPQYRAAVWISTQDSYVQSELGGEKNAEILSEIHSSRHVLCL